MSQQIKDTVSSCSLCEEYAPAQPKEPLIISELPIQPWSIVAQDLYTLDGNNYLITVDAFNGYWKVDPMLQIMAQAIVHKTKQHFARYGIPDGLYTDNGPKFDCAEFTRFAYKWKFKHHTSSPYHSQSNRLIEAAVKTTSEEGSTSKKDQWLSFWITEILPKNFLNWKLTSPLG